MFVEVFENEMRELISEGSSLIKLETGFQFTEGPVWNRIDHNLYFSDIPSDTIFRYSEQEGLSVHIKPSNFSNGLVFDSKQRLLACEHRTRRVIARSDVGVEVLADQYSGKKLNSPNDLIVAKNGSVLFSDPLYGLRPNLGGIGTQELDFQGVFQATPGKDELTLIADDFDAPNGLAYSPDESKLYVNDTIRMHIRIFDVDENGKITGGDWLCDVKGEGEGKPDGLKVDVLGNVYCTGPLGIWVFTPKGVPIGRILVPERVANMNWGGKDYNTLYIAASTSIYKIKLLVSGNLV